MIKSLKPTELLKYVCVYGIFALLVTVRQLNYLATFTLVYFLSIGLVIFFVEPILNKTVTAHTKICFNIFLAAVFFASTYEQFSNVSGQLNKMLSAAGSALFVAGLIAVTDKKKFNYCALIIPLLLFIDKKMCICMSAVFLAIFILNIFIEPKKAKQKSSKKQKAEKQDPPGIIYVIVALLGLVASIVLYMVNYAHPSGSFSYFLRFGLNCFTAVPVIVFVLVKLIRNEASFIRPVCIGLFVLIGISVFCAVCVELTALVVSILSILFFLCYCCLQSEKIFDSIKADYENHRLAFWTVAVLLLV